MHRILFVCLGNICRSPAAEGVFAHLARTAGRSCFVDSAGTGNWHAGALPDTRMVAAAAKRNIDLTPCRARIVTLADFYEFDYMLAMDSSNRTDLLAMAPPNHECDIRLFLDFAPDLAQRGVADVPDPYYGGKAGFEHVLDLVTQASAGFLAHLMDGGDT